MLTEVNFTLSDVATALQYSKYNILDKAPGATLPYINLTLVARVAGTLFYKWVAPYGTNMKGETLTLTDVRTNGTLADVNAGDSFEVLQVWYDRLGKTRASIGKMSEHGHPVETHTVLVREETLKFAPGAANINTVTGYEVEG